jgi:hypothetical protein
LPLCNQCTDHRRLGAGFACTNQTLAIDLLQAWHAHHFIDPDSVAERSRELRRLAGARLEFEVLALRATDADLALVLHGAIEAQAAAIDAQLGKRGIGMGCTHDQGQGDGRRNSDGAHGVLPLACVSDRME